MKNFHKNISPEFLVWLYSSTKIVVSPAQPWNFSKEGKPPSKFQSWASNTIFSLLPTAPIAKAFILCYSPSAFSCLNYSHFHYFNILDAYFHVQNYSCKSFLSIQSEHALIFHNSRSGPLGRNAWPTQ